MQVQTLANMADPAFENELLTMLDPDAIDAYYHRHVTPSVLYDTKQNAFF